MGSTIVRNLADSYVSSATPKKNYGTVAKMYVGTGFYSYLFFGNPIPAKAKVVSAKLHFFSASSWAGSITATAQLMNGAWSANKVTWNNDPGVTGGTATQAKTGAGKGTHWIIDITAMMQAVSNGTRFYGIRLSASGSAQKALFSMQATAQYRPYVELTWSDAPFPPNNLNPRAGRVVGTNKPLLHWNFVDYSGNRNQQSFQVQISTNSGMTAIVHDSGTVASALPQYDLAPTAFSATADTVYYWRVMTTDGAGLPSAWSAVESFSYHAYDTITITNPSTGAPYVEESTPPIAWTTSGTQTAYQVILYGPDDVTVLWNSGKVTTTDLFATIPAGKITVPGAQYRVVVRIWDNRSRTPVPGFPDYQEVEQTFTFNLNNTVTPVTDIDVTMDSTSVAAVIVVHRATMPDSFTILRNGVVVATDLQPVDYQDSVDTTKYTFLDFPPGRVQTTWTVLAVVNGKSSQTNPTDSLFVSRALSWITSPDNVYQCAFANPGHDLEDGEESAVLQAIDSAPILITQSLFGEMGSFSGRIANDVAGSLTAKQMRDNLRTIRESYNGEARLFFSDEVMDVYIHHLKVHRQSYPNGTTEYDVEFEFFEG